MILAYVDVKVPGPIVPLHELEEVRKASPDDLIIENLWGMKCVREAATIAEANVRISLDNKAKKKGCVALASDDSVSARLKYSIDKYNVYVTFIFTRKYYTK